jgi:hypothetical protein
MLVFVALKVDYISDSLTRYLALETAVCSWCSHFAHTSEPRRICADV